MSRVVVAAGPPAVFDALRDRELVARCLPGYRDDAAGGTVVLRTPSGPVPYAVRAGVAEVDPAERVIALDVALARDGEGDPARWRASVRAQPADGGTLLEVAVPQQPAVPGELAAWPQLLERLLRQFGANLEASLVGPDAGGGSPGAAAGAVAPGAAGGRGDGAAPPAGAGVARVLPGDLVERLPALLRRSWPALAATLAGLVLGRLLFGRGRGARP